MSMDWFDQNAGGGEPSVYFGKVGDKVVGTITALPRAKEFIDDQGRTQSVLVVPMRAHEGCTATKGKKGADGVVQAGDDVAVFIRAGFMAGAVAEAIREAGAKGLAEGDTLAIAFSGEKDTGKVQPAKEYQARYVPAKPNVSVESLV